MFHEFANITLLSEMKGMRATNSAACLSKGHFRPCTWSVAAGNYYPVRVLNLTQAQKHCPAENRHTRLGGLSRGVVANRHQYRLALRPKATVARQAHGCR